MMCEYVANLICGCKDKAFIWIVQASTNHSTRNSAEWCESSGTGTLVRYLSRISGTCPYESQSLSPDVGILVIYKFRYFKTIKDI